MKKLTTLLLVVNAAEVDKTAYELCKSANTWEEYKEIFENFQYERGDSLGRILKALPKEIENSSTFIAALSYGGIKDEEVDEFADAIRYATSLYNNNKTGHLRFFVEKKDLESPYRQVDAFIEDNALTHIGNVVKCYDIPYYSNVNNYLTE